MKSSRRILVNLKADKGEVLSGIGRGDVDRKKFQLDEADKNNLNVYVFVDPDIHSIKSSYFLSMFGDSVRNLGESLFRDRYIFDCSEVIREQCIEPGIKDALKE